jgi:hypothetical protein
VRLRLEDTPAFRVIEQREEVADAPVKESFTAHGGESLTAFGFTIAWTVSYYILLTRVEARKPPALAERMNRLRASQTTCFRPFRCATLCL